MFMTLIQQQLNVMRRLALKTTDIKITTFKGEVWTSIRMTLNVKQLNYR